VDLQYARLRNIKYTGLFERLGHGYRAYITPENMLKLGIEDGEELLEGTLFESQGPVPTFDNGKYIPPKVEPAAIERRQDDFPF
jgi:hypothetical protein